jgi:hypothetical protein
MLENVLRDVALWCWTYSATKPSHMRVDVDGLACPLHRPMACSRQMRGQGFMPGATLSRRAVVGDGAFPGDVKPLSLDTCWSGDRLDSYGCQSRSWSSWFGKVHSC